MQSVAYSHNKPRVAAAVKSQNQFKPQRRDSIQHRAILAAVREWESTLPGQAQERIAQLVAEEWAKADGRGIAVNKQNLFRYLKMKGVRKVHGLRYAAVRLNHCCYASSDCQEARVK